MFVDSLVVEVTLYDLRCAGFMAFVIFLSLFLYFASPS